MGWWTADRQAYAYNRLISGGLSPYGAAALVSRWMNVEASQGPTAVNPSSGAFGIAQWLGARKSGIYPNTDFDAQLDYVLAELNGSEARAGDVLRSAASTQEGAIGASMYERAEGYNGQTDNYTSRTAAGVGPVLALVGAAYGTPGPPGVYQFSDNQSDLGFDLNAYEGSGLSSPIVIVGIALAALLALHKLEIL